jgi:hypothetical protein
MSLSLEVQIIHRLYPGGIPPELSVTAIVAAILEFVSGFEWYDRASVPVKQQFAFELTQTVDAILTNERSVTVH